MKGGHVLHVTASSNRRGAEIFASDLSNALASRGRVSRIISLVPGTGEVLPLSSLGSIPLGLLTLRRLRALLAAHETIVGHGSTSLPACTLGGLGLRKRFIYRSIGDPAFWHTRPGRKTRTAAMLRRADRVVALWAGAADKFMAAGVDRGRLCVIPNGVPAERFPLADAATRDVARSRLAVESNLGKEKVVAYVGALTPEKEVHRIIRAVASQSGARLLVAGGGPLRSSLEAFAASALGERARFLGSLSNVATVIAAADIVMLSSRSEGMPAVLIEAGLSGVPVVATDVGAVRAIVVDGVSGTLVPPGDQDALDLGLRRTMEDPPPAGQEARRHCVKHFGLDAVATAWENLIFDQD